MHSSAISRDALGSRDIHRDWTRTGGGRNRFCPFACVQPLHEVFTLSTDSYHQPGTPIKSVQKRTRCRSTSANRLVQKREPERRKVLPHFPRSTDYDGAGTRRTDHAHAAVVGSPPPHRTDRTDRPTGLSTNARVSFLEAQRQQAGNANDVLLSAHNSATTVLFSTRRCWLHDTNVSSELRVRKERGPSVAESYGMET